MRPDPTRRAFLGLCASGIPIGLVACSPGEVVCDTSGWMLPAKPAGSFFDCLQMSVMSDLANLIVGQGDWPTADDAAVVSYLDQIFADWAGPELKARLSRMPEQMDRFSVDQRARAYVQLDQADRAKLLAKYDAKAFEDRTAEASATYIEFKSLVLNIYNKSAEANRDFVRVPGAYLGDLSASEHLELLRDKAEGFTG